MFNLPIFPVGVPEEVGDVGLAFVLFLDRGHVYRSFIGAHARCFTDMRTKRNPPGGGLFSGYV